MFKKTLASLIAAATISTVTVAPAQAVALWNGGEGKTCNYKFHGAEWPSLEVYYENLEKARKGYNGLMGYSEDNFRGAEDVIMYSMEAKEAIAYEDRINDLHQEFIAAVKAERAKALTPAQKASLGKLVGAESVVFTAQSRFLPAVKACAGSGFMGFRDLGLTNIKPAKPSESEDPKTKPGAPSNEGGSLSSEDGKSGQEQLIAIVGTILTILGMIAAAAPKIMSLLSQFGIRLPR